MKLLSKKEVQKIRSQAIDKSNLDKSKVDEALSKSLRDFNNWKTQKIQEEYKIEQEFHGKINGYNAQIDDLIKEIEQLKKQRAYQLTPVNKLLQEAKIELEEAKLKRSECERLRSELDVINEKNKEVAESLDKKEQQLWKRETILNKDWNKCVREKELIKSSFEKLTKDKIDFINNQAKLKKINNDKLDEIRIKRDEIKLQILNNKEQKIQNIKDQAKIISDRQALNAGWEELKKLKSKYDRC